MKSKLPQLYTCIVILIALLSAAAVVQAQPGGRGGGGGRGGFGGFGGGGRGGTGGGRGGPGGSSDFRQRMMERMDRNGNGKLEENEVQGPARGFLDAMARRAGIEPKYPMSIASISGGGGRSDRGRRRDNDEDEEFEYPLVAGFGDEKVTSFGFDPNLLNGRIIDVETAYEERIISQLDRTMDRYDKDKSGVLEYEEWRGVPWQTDPRESDLDNDGRLTRAEMAERYKESNGGSRGRDSRDRGGRDRGGNNGRDRGGDRGGDRGAASSRGGPGGGRGGNTGGRGGPGGGRGGFDPGAMLSRMDRDGDGKVKLDEMDERVRGFASRMLERVGMDTSKGVIDIKEVSRRFRERQQGGGQTAQGKKAEEKKEVPGSERFEGASQYGGSYSYRKASPKVKDVPDWWEERDDNEDGQVSIAEYFTSRSARQRQRELREFDKLDLNEDGIITPTEASAVDE